MASSAAPALPQPPPSLPTCSVPHPSLPSSPSCNRTWCIPSVEMRRPRLVVRRFTGTGAGDIAAGAEPGILRLPPLAAPCPARRPLHRLTTSRIHWMQPARKPVAMSVHTTNGSLHQRGQRPRKVGDEVEPRAEHVDVGLGPCVRFVTPRDAGCPSVARIPRRRGGATATLSRRACGAPFAHHALPIPLAIAGCALQPTIVLVSAAAKLDPKGLVGLARHGGGRHDRVPREGARRAQPAQDGWLGVLVHVIQVPNLEGCQRGDIKQDAEHCKGDHDVRVHLHPLPGRAVAIQIIQRLQHKEQGEAAQEHQRHSRHEQLQERLAARRRAFCKQVAQKRERIGEHRGTVGGQCKRVGHERGDVLRDGYAGEKAAGQQQHLGVVGEARLAPATGHPNRELTELGSRR
eukprot:scaffold6362_cov123-Isochrysis_galbana.AAC.4